jgi:transposase, IS30 family
MHHMAKYTHLNLEERERLFLYLNQGKKFREIGRLLKRDHRTIAREITRNRKEVEVGTHLPDYLPSVAQTLTQKRRSTAKVGIRKLDDPAFKRFVIRKLGNGWSPEQIAGRLQLKTPLLKVTHETIYQFIYAKENRKLRLFELLRKRHQHRQLQYGRRSQQLQIPGRIWIEARPESANLRLEVGHWETDNMEGKRKTKGCVSACVDRKSLLTKLTKLVSKEAKEKEAALIRDFSHWPRALVKTITYDNGTENHTHQQVASILKCATYFCHPYHSWEKGTVENTLGLVREYLPKGLDLNPISQGELSWIADQLNQRPRKKLGYYTPSEIFEKETGWGT